MTNYLFTRIDCNFFWLNIGGTAKQKRKEIYENKFQSPDISCYELILKLDIYIIQKGNGVLKQFK